DVFVVKARGNKNLSDRMLGKPDLVRKIKIACSQSKNVRHVGHLQEVGPTARERIANGLEQRNDVFFGNVLEYLIHHDTIELTRPFPEKGWCIANLRQALEAAAAAPLELFRAVVNALHLLKTHMAEVLQKLTGAATKVEDSSVLVCGEPAKPNVLGVVL